MIDAGWSTAESFQGRRLLVKQIWRGISFRICLFFEFCSLLASWLFGFSASGLFGFGFSHPLHSQFLFGRWRFGFCVYAAFGGFGFLHPLLSQFLSGFFCGFCTLSLVFGFGFPHHKHHQFLRI